MASTPSDYLRDGTEVWANCVSLKCSHGSPLDLPALLADPKVGEITVPHLSDLGLIVCGECGNKDVHLNRHSPQGRFLALHLPTVLKDLLAPERFHAILPSMEDQESQAIPVATDRAGELALKALEHVVKLGVVANAGGAIATITVIAASAKNGEFLNILALPLALFAMGIVLALMTIAGILFALGEMSKGEEGPWVGPWKYLAPFLSNASDGMGIGIFICFVLGCLSGISIIAVA